MFVIQCSSLLIQQKGCTTQCVLDQVKFKRILCTKKLLEVHTQIDALKEHALAPWNFDKLPGSNPQSWPVGLDTLNERLKSLPELNFFYEPFDLNESFKTKSKQFVENTLAKIKKEGAKAAESEDINHLVSALDAILTISFHTGSFHEIVT